MSDYTSLLATTCLWIVRYDAINSKVLTGGSWASCIQDKMGSVCLTEKSYYITEQATLYISLDVGKSSNCGSKFPHLVYRSSGFCYMADHDYLLPNPLLTTQYLQWLDR